MTNEYTQFRLRQRELEKQARHERQLTDLRKQDKWQRRDRKEQKQNSLLTRISVLF